LGVVILSPPDLAVHSDAQGRIAPTAPARQITGDGAFHGVTT